MNAVTTIESTTQKAYGWGISKVLKSHIALHLQNIGKRPEHYLYFEDNRMCLYTYTDNNMLVYESNVHLSNTKASSSHAYLIELDKLKSIIISRKESDFEVKVNVDENNVASIQINMDSFEAILPLSVKFDHFEQLLSMRRIPDEFQCIELPLDTALFDAYSNATKFTSEDDLKPAMNGVLTTFVRSDAGNELLLCSTDAHQMYVNRAIANVDLTEMQADTVSHIVPSCFIKAAETVANAAKSIGDMDDDSSAVMRFFDSYVHFECSNFSVHGSYIEGRFPDFYSVLSDIGKYKPLAVIKLEELQNEVKSMYNSAVITNKVTYLAVLESVKNEFDSVDLTLTTQSTSSATKVKQSILDVECHADLADMKIGVNCKLLKTIVDSLDGETAYIYAASPSRPMFILTRPLSQSELDDVKKIREFNIVMPVMLGVGA